MKVYNSHGSERKEKRETWKDVECSRTLEEMLCSVDLNEIVEAVVGIHGLPKRSNSGERMMGYALSEMVGNSLFEKDTYNLYF